MAKDAWTRSELFEGLDPAPAFVAELERFGLLVVVGQDGAGHHLYAPQSRAQLEKVLGLVEMGYQPVDIAAIAQRVGDTPRPRRHFKRPPLHLTEAELCDRAGVDLERLRVWREAGLLEPSLRANTDDPLFDARMAPRVGRLKGLAALGIAPESLRGWGEVLHWLDSRRAPGAMSADQARRIEGSLRELSRRLEALGGGHRRWRRMVLTYERRLARRRPTTGQDS